ncbi:MAG: hypothetical protein CML16_09965, partial [Pusillimonas sp.]|nr:hypothetical protein [Pusillimonas sp.]MBC43128.1 hypothetical protein [Pusillimonas sp.]
MGEGRAFRLSVTANKKPASYDTGFSEFWLSIIKGGRPVFIKLVFSTNRLNGGNTDVPNRFYLRFARFD